MDGLTSFIREADHGGKTHSAPTFRSLIKGA